ncbi:hypothetical protein [Mesorhizobium sp. M0243]|uniref:hypothetical protein n=1 Tax=unclassified Mesorhizobium TaxID=325217 RepID=UPI003338C049
MQFGLLRRHGDEYRLERNDFVETGQSASLHDADKSLFCTARGPPFAPESLRHGLSGRRRTPSPFGLSAPVHAFDERHQLVRLSVPHAELTKLKDLTLVPGMPAEAMVQTGEPTALSYFVKPLSDQISRAFHE